MGWSFGGNDKEHALFCLCFVLMLYLDYVPVLTRALLPVSTTASHQPLARAEPRPSGRNIMEGVTGGWEGPRLDLQGPGTKGTKVPKLPRNLLHVLLTATG